MRIHDWSSTPLGPPESWPQSLRTVVSILLTSRYAMWVGWGDELTFLYNDTYKPTLGLKHPAALGAPAPQVWAEIWEDIRPRVETVLSTGEATYDEGLLLFLERSGFSEETYHTFSYSPLADDNGRINGMLCVVTEETERVIGERRMTTLRRLSSELAGANTQAKVMAAVERELAANPADLPFTLTCLHDQLVCSTGLLESHQLKEVCAGASEPGVIDLDPSLQVPKGAWGKAPQQAVLVPLRQQGQPQAMGILTIGLNPFRRYDAAYAGFVDLLSAQIVAGITSAKAYEEERRRAESLAELDRAKTVFFSNVSHEFRTPLTLILGPVEEILSAQDNAVDLETKRVLSVVQRNGLRLQRLVNTLLDFSRIEAGRAAGVYEPTDLGSLTADISSSFRSVIERAGLSFTIDCPPLPRPVYLDRDMWEKVVLNLISNALKYTFSGAITVRTTESGSLFGLEVSDTGIGIPADQVPLLFDRFHRVEGASARTQEGTGIGLSLVKEIVKMHGGSVDVGSTEGQGSTFTVRLPFGTSHLPPDHVGHRNRQTTPVLAEAFVAEASRWLSSALSSSALPPSAYEEWESSAPGPSGARSRILLADDNSDMREYVTRLLASLYQVTAVENGRLALDSAIANPPDLILTDVMMPELDGFALLRELRRRDETRTIPVILLSARAGEESRIEGLEEGADDYLTKPFSARELQARVAAHLGLSGMRRAAAEAIRESEERYRTFVDTVSSVVWIMDDMGKMTGSSVSWGAFTGQALDQYRGWGWLDALHPDDRGPTIKGWHEAVSRGNAYQAAYRLRRSDGEYRDVISRGAPVLRSDGTRKEWVGACTDVTDARRAAARLQESEERFTRAFEGAPVGMVLSTPDGRILEANQAYLKMLGYSMEELVARDSAGFTHPDDIVPTRQFSASLRDKVGSTAVIKKRYFRKDGQLLWVRVSATLRPIGEGNTEQLIAIIEDITAQVEAEIEVREQERRLEEDRRRWRELLAQTPAAICVLHGPDHRFEWLNEDYARLCGRPAEQLIGKTVREALPEVVDQGYIDFLDRVYQTGERHFGQESLVRIALHGDAPLDDFYLNFVYLPTRDAEGRIQGVFVHASDVTAMVQARQRIEESEERFRSLANATPVFIWLTGPDKAAIWYNESWLQFTGRPMEQDLGFGWREAIHFADRKRIEEIYTAAFDSRSRYSMEYRMKNRTGEWRWLLAEGVPRYDGDGAFLGYIGTCLDITGRKEAEEALRKTNRELEEFAYVSSHDLQEPLRMVNIYTQLLLKNVPDTPGTQEYRGFIHHGVRRMEELLRDLLTFSRTVHSEAAPGGAVDLAVSLSRALSVLKSRVDEQHARIICDPLPVASGDESQLVQVFQNLLSNSLKYAREDTTPEIHISAELDGARWIISVKDNGIGFEPQYAGRIFGLFKRLHKDAFPGTGLGLAICKRIVERYGGSIWAEGHPDEGATFYFSLPVAEVQ